MSSDHKKEDFELGEYICDPIGDCYHLNIELLAQKQFAENAYCVFETVRKLKLELTTGISNLATNTSEMATSFIIQYSPELAVFASYKLSKLGYEKYISTQAKNGLLLGGTTNNILDGIINGILLDDTNGIPNDARNKIPIAIIKSEIIPFVNVNGDAADSLTFGTLCASVLAYWSAHE